MEPDGLILDKWSITQALIRPATHRCSPKNKFGDKVTKWGTPGTQLYETSI